MEGGKGEGVEGGSLTVATANGPSVIDFGIECKPCGTVEGDSKKMALHPAT